MDQASVRYPLARLARLDDDGDGDGDGENHINGIENFWSQAKRVLRKYNGIPKTTFPLFLKECEFRFNYGTPKQQLKTLKEWAGI